MSELGWEWPSCEVPCLLYLHTRKPKDQSTIFIPKAKSVLRLLSFLILGTPTGLKLNIFWKVRVAQAAGPRTTPSTPL